MSGKGTDPSSPAKSPSLPVDQIASSKDPDRFLPIANVSRLMKRSLPTNAKISKEAKETVQECVSEFISFITGEASDKCQREKRKTINGDDLLWAMTTLGFEDYVGPLKNYLSKYRELEGDKSSMVRQDQGPAANDHNHQQQLNIMSGHIGVPNFDKFFNFGGSDKRGFHDGLMGVEDFDKVVNFGDCSNKGLLQISHGGAVDYQHEQHLGSSTSNGFGNGGVVNAKWC